MRKNCRYCRGAFGQKAGRMLNIIAGLFTKYFILSHRSRQNIVIFEVILLVLMAVKAYRERQVKKSVVCYVLYSYVFWIFVSAVLARIHWEIWNVKPVDFSKINWLPFYSYSIIAAGNKAYLQQVVMNCWMLFPVGFLLPGACGTLKISSGVKICFCLSAAIEILQLIYGCGLCEVDDIIHNVLGGFLGVCFFRLSCKISILLKRKIYEIRRHQDESEAAKNIY